MEQYISAYHRYINDILEDENCIKYIDGKRTFYLSVDTQLKLLDTRNVIDFVTEEDLELYNKFCKDKPCELCCEEYQSMIYGIVDKITINNDLKCFDIHFKDYVIDYYYEDDLMDVTIGDIVIHADSVNNSSITFSYEGYKMDDDYDEDEYSPFIITPYEYFNILDMCIDVDISTDKELIEDIYKKFFNDKLEDNPIELWDSENECVDFHPVDIKYNNYNEECDIKLTKSDIKKLSEYYKGKVVSFCDGDYNNPETIYFGEIKHIKMNHRTNEITLYMNYAILYEEDNIMISDDNIVLDKRFNKALVEKRLDVDNESFQKVLQIAWNYSYIKEETIYDDYKLYEKSR